MEAQTGERACGAQKAQRDRRCDAEQSAPVLSSRERMPRAHAEPEHRSRCAGRDEASGLGPGPARQAGETEGFASEGRRQLAGCSHVRSLSAVRRWRARGMHVLLALVLLRPYVSNAQYSFKVEFYEPTEPENLEAPRVECTVGAFPRDGTSCNKCTVECMNDPNNAEYGPANEACLCINEFKIVTTQVNLFNGLDEDVDVCQPTDTNGNVVDLNDNDYRISISSKSTTFNAPNGHSIQLTSEDIECNEGKWSVQYVTTIAGQYIIDIQLKTGETAAGDDILIRLEDREGFPAPFEIPATKVAPGEKAGYFIDTVISLRPICRGPSLVCQHCRFTDAGGTECAGNDMVPAVEQPSQIIVYPGDRFKNAVDEANGCLEADKVIGTNKFKALKISERMGSDCCSTTSQPEWCQDPPQREVCRSVETRKLAVETWGTLATIVSCKDLFEEDPVSPTEYYIQFTPSRSGFYSIQVPPGEILTASLGPLVIPVEAAAVDAAKSFAFGDGIISAVQSELATFTIQPMDRFGNHHTSGLHVFQVVITQVEPALNFNIDVDPADTGKGFSTVQYQLQNPAVYALQVFYCKDLLHYPPYTAAENRVCDLTYDGDGPGPEIKSSPFKVTIRTYEFFVPLISVPGMMTQFREGNVGVQYYALFTANFPVCGQEYGTPSVSSRYNPVVRFDLAEMKYTVDKPAAFLPQSGVRSDDADMWASTRYASYAGSCLDAPDAVPGGYVFTFQLTVSGAYKVWLYADSTSYRPVAESPRNFVIHPDDRVIENFRGSGPVVNCEQEIDCMANQDTWLIVQAKDRFFNNATSCDENIAVHVMPIMKDSDHFRVSNLVELADIGGVPLNGVPGPGITQSTRSGYVAMPINDFRGLVKSCNEGTYTISVLASLSAQYQVAVTVNDNELFGSPFPLTIYPQQRQILPNVATSGLVTLTRWTYYRVYLDQDNVGFSVEVVKTDDNDGQPWTYMRYEDIFADIQEPDLSAGIRYELPDARSSTYCRNCRIHVPPSKSKLGLYYISIYGFEDDSYHTVTASTYTDTYISSASVTLGSLEPGRYAYYRFHVDSTSGFQVRVSASDGTQGSLTATLKKDDYPLTDQDPSSVFGQALMQTKCQDCIIDHPPTLWARGDWYLAVLCHVYPVNFRVALLEFSETPLEFGSQSNRLSLSSLTWGYYTFTIEPDMEPEGFKLDVIPTDASYNLTTVLKKAQHPITLTDSTFKSQPCTHCRITVMTRQKLQATWYIGIYAGATGGEFELKIKLMEACPNNCFGNGVCVQRKIKVCRCFPGYTGLDCREAIKEKVFAWYPMDGHAADATDNKRPLFYKVNRDGKLQYENDGLTLLDTYVIIPKPTPDVACSQFTRMDEPELGDLQWGSEQVTNEGTSKNNRVQAVLPELGEWYQWNELGKPKGNPRVQQTCAEYNPRRELTVMFKFRVGSRGLSPGSLMTLGKPSLVVGRHDADEAGKWSWSLYPQNHPNGRHVVFDLYLRNLTHEISLREEEIYPIDGLPIFEKPDFWQRKFPNGWCADGVRPVRKDGICRYLEKEEYYHIAMVFAPRRVELYVDAVLVGVMKLDLWNITDTEGGRIQFGHDPRYSPYERLFFGQVRDIRILRYAASQEEIGTLVNNSETWFKWREAVRNSIGTVTNPGSADDPIPLSGLDDGSLDSDLSPHAEVCQSFRNPNEPREMQQESNCPFIDTDTSWILKEQKDRYYRKHDTDRTPFGLGHEELILLDTRPKQEVYLGRFYDFSIDEE